MKPGVGVGVLVLKDNKVLLGLRNPNKVKASTEIKGEGTWTMPGGKVEYMEKLIDAAKRELKEETALNGIELELICITDDITSTAHYVTAGFIANKFDGEVKVMEPDTIIKWEWFNLDNLPENMYEPSKKLLKKYSNGTMYE